MAKITIKTDKCKGCGLCVIACPKKVLELSGDNLNSKGYFPAVAVHMDHCIGCAFCAQMCPDCAIKVER